MHLCIRYILSTIRKNKHFGLQVITVFEICILFFFLNVKGKERCICHEEVLNCTEYTMSLINQGENGGKVLNICLFVSFLQIVSVLNIQVNKYKPNKIVFSGGKNYLFLLFIQFLFYLCILLLFVLKSYLRKDCILFFMV